jgi:hypothetical protein
VSGEHGVTDIRAFATEVAAAYARRPDGDGAIEWLGDVEQVVRDGDEHARRGLASKLIALAADADAEDDSAEEERVAGLCASVIGETNAIIARQEGALVSFDERPVSADDLVELARTLQGALDEGGHVATVTAGYLAAGVLADPREPRIDGGVRERVARELADELQLARELPFVPAMPTIAAPLGPGERLHAILLSAGSLGDTDKVAVAPDGHTRAHYLWGRIARLAAALLEAPPFGALERTTTGAREIDRSVRLAVGLLAGSPVAGAPVCFEHERAAADVRFEARELLSRWLDRALGYLEQSEQVGVVRDRRDFASLRGILAQALIGAWCAAS